MTVVPYANNLDLDETQSNSASHPDPSCLHSDNIFTNFERHWSTLNIEEDDKKLADDNLFGGLRVNTHYICLNDLVLHCL